MHVVYSEYEKKHITETEHYTDVERGTMKRIELVKKITNSMAMISQFPRSAKFDIDLGLHYKLIPKLPFITVYAVETEYVRVVKILHTKRER